MTRTDPPRTRTNPQEIRRKNFTVRIRGLDPDEVRFFMAGLADDLEGLQAQVATLTLENDSLCGRALGLRQTRWISSPTRPLACSTRPNDWPTR